MAAQRNEYVPDYIVRPGSVLEEILEARNIRKNQFAELCGRTPKSISQIIRGEAPITPELAIRFNRILGSSSALWNNLEANYRLQLAQKQEQEEFRKQISWAKEFPINELIKRGFVNKAANETELVSGILGFFGVGSVNAWREHYTKLAGSFRHSSNFKSDPKALAAWLRIGESCAERIECQPYDQSRFRAVLNQIRTLTQKKPDKFEIEMKGLCRGAGVVLVFEPGLPKTHLSGATRWLSKDKALIMLSLRHKTDDHLWFMFFHEAGHILFDGKKEIFIDGEDGTGDQRIHEKKANRFAANVLIPPHAYEQFVAKSVFDKASIMRFARDIGIAPGIVVGRLQREKKIDYSWHNQLKQRFEFGGRK